MAENRPRYLRAISVDAIRSELDSGDNALRKSFRRIYSPQRRTVNGRFIASYFADRSGSTISNMARVKFS